MAMFDRDSALKTLELIQLTSHAVVDAVSRRCVPGNTAIKGGCVRLGLRLTQLM